jgi:5'-3' exonuclease
VAPELFDSNQISPGTPFMNNLGKKLEWFVKFKLNTDPIYQKCERVAVSDSSVPGEGEHKMMDYIRNLKLEPGYDPNTRHVFYGPDADLIMLSLLTHEPHFMIIREEHKKKRSPPKGAVKRPEVRQSPDMQLIHISVLREYFLLEYRECATKMKLRFDIERIIDDFVFFCFFIGNDFLPSLSALDIAEGALEHLIAGYKSLLPTMTDYITDSGIIHWDRAEPFIALLAAHEDANL